MKINCILIALPLISLCLIGCSPNPKQEDIDTIFQTTTITALLEGNYDGNLTMKELRKHGDFGLGTFQDLNGEMITLNDTVYQIHYNGNVYLVHDSVKTPFSVIANHNSDTSWSFQELKDLEQLKQEIDQELKSMQMIYAIKINGEFEYVKTRSVPQQAKPYPKLADAIKHQSIFEFQHINGTIVGFRFPDYLKEVNVPGYHFHFIDRNRKCGGHLLNCTIMSGNIQIDKKDKLLLILPEDAENGFTQTPETVQQEWENIE